MMQKRLTLTTQVHHIIKKHLKPGDIVIDATIGNGHDSLFLAQQVGKTGKVIGFDIQQQAITATQTKLQEAGFIDNITLILDSHDTMLKHMAITQFKGIQAIVFNLGYLPGSDKSIITQTRSTKDALDQAIKLISKTGVISITAYPGHSGGDQECESINQWCKELDQEQYNIETIYCSDKAHAPRAFVISPTNQSYPFQLAR